MVSPWTVHGENDHYAIRQAAQCPDPLDVDINWSETLGRSMSRNDLEAIRHGANQDQSDWQFVDSESSEVHGRSMGGYDRQALKEDARTSRTGNSLNTNVWNPLDGPVGGARTSRTGSS